MKMTPGAVLAGATGGFNPGAGADLTTHGDEREVSGLIRKWIGVFNPTRININTRLLMRYDPDVAFGLAIRRAPIVNLNWTVESKDPLIAAFIESQVRPVYRQLAKGASLAIPFGFQVMGKEWVVRDVTIEAENKVDGTTTRKTIKSAWTYKRFKSIDSRTVTLLVDPATDDWGGVRQAVSGRKEPIEVGRDKAFLWSHAKEDNFGRLEGWPLIDQAYEPWWWKCAANVLTNRYYERRADPTPIATADPRTLTDKSGLEMDGFEYMRRIMRDLKAGAFVVVPSARDDKGNPFFDIKYLTDDQRGEMWQLRVDKNGAQILRGLLVTDKAGTSSEGDGSLAMARQHAETLDDTQETTVSDWLDEGVNPQVVEPLVRANFGDRAVEESKTRIVGAGISSRQHELMKQVFLNVLNAEQLTESGQTIPNHMRLNMVGLAEELKLPMHTSKEIEKLAKQVAKNRELPGPGQEDDELDVDEETEREATKALEKKGSLDR